MANITRPADSLTSDDDPTPRMSPFKKRFIYEPVYYFGKLTKKYPDVDMGRLLELASAVQPDATQAWATGKDEDRADYLVAVEEKIQAYLTSQRPEIALRQNTWADDVLGRQRWWSPKVTFVMKNMPCGLSEAEELILTGLNKRCPPDDPLRSKDDLYKFPGNADAASGAVTDEMKARKEQMAKTTVPLWTKDHDEKLTSLAAEFKVVPSQIATMATDILHMSVRDANKELHPDRILAQIKAGLPSWTKQWIAEPPVQVTLPLGGAVEVKDEIAEEDDDELTQALATNLQRLASKSAAPVVEEASPVDEAPAKPVDPPKVDAEPVAPPSTTVDEKPAEEPPIPDELPPVLDVNGDEEFDGREYTYIAHFLARNYRWDVIYKTYCIFSDDEKAQIQKRTADFLSLSQPECNVSHDWQKDTPPIETINRLREEYHKAVASAFDLSGNENERKRADILAAAFEGVVGQGAQGALQTFGYEGTMKRVHKLCIDHKNQEVADLTRKQEEDRKRFDDQQQRALVTTSQAVANVPNGVLVMPPASPIKLPSPAEQTFMDKCAELAVKCLIYPNVAAAFLAIYTGFDMGFGIPASTRLIYAFVGKGGKINIYPSAEAYAAKCLSRQDICERFVVVNDTEESAVAMIKRKGQEQVTIRYTKEQAMTANLWNNSDKPAWKQNPKMMLKRRVSREAAVTFFPEICSDLGITKPEDDDDDVVMSTELPLAASF